MKNSANNKNEIFSYISGFLTASSILFIFIFFVGYKIGFKKLRYDIVEYVKIIKGEYGKSYKDILYLPDDIIDELKMLNVPIDNANVIPIARDKKLLTQPDSALGFILKKNINLDVHLLDFLNYPNLDLLSSLIMKVTCFLII